MALHVYNYMTRALERFEAVTPGKVSLYVCGPTVCDHAHLGHAKTYIAMDVIARYLTYLEYQVRHVRSITDVGHLLPSGEDRLLKGARAHRLEPMEAADTYMMSFFDDMQALGVQRPNLSPRASGHIPEIIQWVQALLAAGAAYEVNGNVYFSVEAFPDYGKLSRRSAEELEAGSPVEACEEKRHPADFALWRRARPEQLLRWPSPWGDGCPGWHIGCTVMATHYLGQPFDIHGGGLENIFPHNECEMAPAEALHGEPFARYWLLSGSLTVNGVKMSQRLGNFLTIKEALALYKPEAIRYFILSCRYRDPLDFSREALQTAQRSVERLHNTVREIRRRMGTAMPAGTAVLADVSSLADYREAFEAAMDDDFNTPEALAVLFEMVKEANRQLDKKDDLSMGSLAAMEKQFRDLAGGVLGILPVTLEVTTPRDTVLEGLMQILLDLRQEYRAAGEGKQADMLRDRLTLLGITLTDGPEGSSWRLEE